MNGTINAAASIDAVLLASGFSRRFGSNKLLALFDGLPLARRALELASSLNMTHGLADSGLFANVLYVCREDAAHLAAGLNVTVIRNDHPEYGARESVRLGVSASRAGAYMFFHCDQPLLDADTVSRIAAAFRTAGADNVIARPCFRSRPGNPVLFSSAFRNELLNLGAGEHPRGIIARHGDAVVNVELENETPLLDADTPDALHLTYEAYLQRQNHNP